MKLVPVPCKFCGRQPEELADRMEPHGYYIHYLACKCGGTSVTASQSGCGDSPEEARRYAIKGWNRDPFLHLTREETT